MKCATLYTPVHVGIWQHRKTLALALALKIRVREAVGLVIEVVHLAVTHAPDGCLDGWTEATLGQALGKGPKGMVRALINAGFIDETDGRLSMHEWELYSGAGLKIRAKETQRKRSQRNAKRSTVEGHPVAVPALSHGTGDGQTRDVPSLSGSVPPPNVNSERERERELESESESPAAGQAMDTEHSLIGGWISEPEEEEQTEPAPRPTRKVPDGSADVPLRATRPPTRKAPRGVHGLNAEASRPGSLDELLAVPQVVAMLRELPAYREGIAGCLPPRDAVGRCWDHLENKRRAGEPTPEWGEPYLRYLRVWLNKDYETSRRALEAALRNGTAPPPAVDPQADPRLKPRLNDWENFLGYRNRGGDLANEAWKLADRPYSPGQLRPPGFTDEEAARNRRLLGAFTGNLAEQKTVKDEHLPGGDQ